MYSAFRSACERLLRIPHDPAPPPGDEASARVFRAAPAYFKYLFVVWFLRLGLAIAGVLIFSLSTVPAAYFGMKHARAPAFIFFIVLGVALCALALVLGFALFSLAVLRLEYEKRWYVVTDRSLRIREGVKTVREITFTFANIQNLSITEGPIQRALGIADLKVETAGGGGGGAAHKGQALGLNLHTAFFHGVANATEIKELIQQRLRALRDSGLGDHEEMQNAHPAPAAPAFIEALRAVHAEARAMREAVAR